MKDTASLNLRFKTLGLAASILLASLVGAAAQESNRSDDGSLKEVKFDDVPVPEIVDFMRTSFPENNFVTSGPLHEEFVSLTLRNVDLGEMLLALEIATGGSIEIQEVTDNMISIKAIDEKPGKNNVVRAFSLRDYLERVIRPLGPGNQENAADREKENLDRKLSAYVELEKLLQSTWHAMHSADHGMNPTLEERQSWPKLNFHVESMILVAIGEERQLEVIEEIIAAFEK